MTKPDDLIARLRVAARNRAAADRAITNVTHGPTYESTPAKKTLEWEAAAALTARDEEIRLLREALEPFVKLADGRDARYRERGGNMEDFPDTHPSYDISAYQIRLGAFRKARAALTPPDQAKARCETGAIRPIEGE